MLQAPKEIAAILQCLDWEWEDYCSVNEELLLLRPDFITREEEEKIFSSLVSWTRLKSQGHDEEALMELKSTIEYVDELYLHKFPT